MKKANLGQPLEVGTRRRRHRRRLHRDGLLADEPAPRRRARLDRLPADALRARRRRGGARRDRARGRPDGVPRQPDRDPRRERQGRRRQVHPQPPRRAGRVRTPLAGPDRGLRVRHPGPDRHPGRVAGGGPDLPAGRGHVRDQPRPGQGRPRDVRLERQGRLRLRRLRDRPDDAHRGGRPRQEVRLRDRSLPVRPDRRDRRGQRQDHQLVAPRHARVLRRPAAPAHPDGPALGAHAVDRAGRQLQHAGRARLRRQRRGRRVDPLPDVQLQHLVRPVPLRPVRRLRRCLPRGRHPHGRHQHAQVGGRSCPSSRRRTAGTTAAR